jgi:AraC-like DNA-binding protein
MLLLRALTEVVQRRGIDPASLYSAEADANLTDLDDPQAFCPLPRFEALLNRAAQLTLDPAIGLHCGLHASATSFGLMSPLIGHAPTLRRALQLIQQFQPLLIEGVSIALSESETGTQLRLVVTGSRDDRSFVELVVAGLTRMLFAFGCTRSELRRVCFEHARPAYHQAYGAAFHGAERFGQTFTGIELAGQALDRSNLHNNVALHAVVLAHAEQALKQRFRPSSYAQRVQALLQAAHTSELPDMQATALNLGISVRSLRRQLEHEGTAYRALRQARLHESACTLLRDPKISLQEIAHGLGFSDPTAFHRAFRRWAKLTPAEYRDATYCVIHDGAPETDDGSSTGAQAHALDSVSSTITEQAIGWRG